MVRAKFTCTEIKQTAYNRLPSSPDGTPGAPAKEITLNPVYDQSIADQAFSTATPSGSITMLVNNPAAHSQFEIGRKYFVDFTPAE